jgi:hypothetical protein
MTTTENINNIDLEQHGVNEYKKLLRQEIEKRLPSIMKEAGREFENEEAREYYLNDLTEQAYKQIAQQGTVRLKYKGGSNNYE